MNIDEEKPLIAVIGANGGIGSALVHLLIENGYRIAAGVKDLHNYDASALSEGSHVYELDATSFDSVATFFDSVEKLQGSIYGAALCVGSILLKPAHLTKVDDYYDVINLNLTSAFAVVRSATKKMMKKSGTIVLVSSCAATQGFPNHDAISAAKAGVEGLTRSAASTYAPKHIRVNCVAPGLTETGLSASILQNEATRKTLSDMHPLGRIGKPCDVASAMAWFLDKKQSWVTGQVLGVDGGISNLVKR